MRKLFLLIIMLTVTLSIYPQIMFVADLTGAQETPPVTTTAKGTGMFIFDADSNTIALRVTYARLQGTFTGAHLHIGTLGVSGPVAIPLGFIGNTSTMTLRNIPDSVIVKLLNEDIYINIHSSTFPAGEIRGQLRRVNGVGFSSAIIGSAQVPPVVSAAEGTAYAVLTNGGTELRYSATIAGFTAGITGASLSFGAAGVVGTVLGPVTFTDSTVNGAWTIPADSLILHILKNRLFLNITTAANPTGEIRGQFYRQGEIMFRISMDGAQEVPPVNTPAKGTGWAVVSNNLANLTYSITYAKLSAPFTGSHFHRAPVGVAGPVTLFINFTGNQVNTTLLGIPDSSLIQMLKGNVYANIHSSAFPEGEIRGQLIQSNGIGFTSVLNGQEEVPPNTSPAVGTGWLVYGAPNSEIDSAKYEFTVANLTSAITGAHFHNAPRLVAGPVVASIPWTDSTVTSVTTISDTLIMMQLFRNNIYANVHTTNFPDGEVRGQLFFSGVRSGSVNNIKEEYVGLPEGYSLSQNYPNPFNPSTKIKYSLPADGFVKIRIYNVVGEEVAVLVNKELKAGTYEVNWTAGNLSSGIYFYRIETGTYSAVKKMMLLK